MGEVTNYWHRVFKQAWGETLSLTPWTNWLKSAFIVLPAAGAAALWYFQTGQIAGAGVFAVVISAAMVALIFLWKLVHVPARMSLQNGSSSLPIKPENRLRQASAPVKIASANGMVRFDYSTHDGMVDVGPAESPFRLRFSKASDTSIHFYKDSTNLVAIAKAKNPKPGTRLSFGDFDSSSRVYTLHVGDIGLAENDRGHFIQFRVLEVADDSRGAAADLIAFSFITNGDGSAEFAAVAP